MYHQKISVCPNKRYKVTVVGQLKAPPASQANRPRPFCEIYICENNPNRCGRNVILGTNNKKRTSLTFKTRANQVKADIQIWLYCPGTYQGRMNTIWTDDVVISPA